MQHRAQLRICHQKIRGDRLVHDTANARPEQFCSLREGLRWCEDCEYLVCEIHAAARHDGHRLEPE